jgi:hypothetical protein
MISISLLCLPLGSSESAGSTIVTFFFFDFGFSDKLPALSELARMPDKSLRPAGTSTEMSSTFLSGEPSVSSAAGYGSEAYATLGVSTVASTGWSSKNSLFAPLILNGSLSLG